MKSRIDITCMLTLIVIILSTCSGIGSSAKSKAARKELEKGMDSRSSNKTSVIIGKVIGGDGQQPLLVVACALDQTKRNQRSRIYYSILDHTEGYMLYLPAGKYRLYTIVDFNNNNLFERSETSGIYQEVISIKVGEVKAGIIIESKSKAREFAEFPEKINIVYDYDSAEYSWENGEIVKIYDAIFSANNAEAGLWSSERFFRVFGANIYLVEAYDPSKIPILFIHGIQGSPHDWIPFYIRMDKSRYQPLLYYYPSGMRLELVSRILFEKLDELQKRYQFEKMCLTAHSMGGFVAQALLTNDEFKKEIEYIKLYVTLATPWTGFESADLAIATSPVVLPSWIDISSRSMFIKRLLKRSLPASVPYYLFYGKDDQISGGRALDQRAFASAKGKFGFQVTHSTILSDRKVWQKYEQILQNHFP